MHIRENHPTYSICPGNSDFNPQQILRPDGYQHLLMRLAELRRDAAPFNNPQLIAQHHVNWVLLTLSLRIHRQPRPSEVLTAQSWNTWRQGMLTRRDAAFFDEAGTPVLSSASFHTLIDSSTRKVCPDHPAYEAAAWNCGPELFETGSRIPFSPGKGLPAGERTVPPCWLDYLGHVNNTRYGEILYDAMTESQRQRLKDLASLDIYFLHELRKGERFSVYIEERENRLDISALKRPGGQPAFGARLTFETR